MFNEVFKEKDKEREKEREKEKDEEGVDAMIEKARLLLFPPPEIHRPADKMDKKKQQSEITKLRNRLQALEKLGEEIEDKKE